MKKYLMLLLIFGIITGCNNKNSNQDSSIINTNEQEKNTTINQVDKEKKEVFQFKEKAHDFGLIKQSGGKVSHDFIFTYNGEKTIEVTGLPTSCACTSAKINKTTLNPGEEAVLTVIFNPNLHEEPEGIFYKSASIMTNDKDLEIPEVKIWLSIDLDLGEEAFELSADHEDEEGEHDKAQYTSITPKVFHEMQKNKDFILIDTHIPEQQHIEGTDEFIPYDDIEHNITKLPKNKDAKIVLYCRSGSMSRAAAYQLAEHGYTNVYDLVGGKEAYDEYLLEEE